MADWTRTEIDPPTVVEYRLPNPTNWAEISKVIHAIRTDIDATSARNHDDTVTVRGDDDAIVFSFLKQV